MALTQKAPKAEALLALSTVVGLACGAAHSGSELPPVNRPYVAPSERTIVGDIDPSFDGQNIYLTNNSSVAVVITSVHLYDCQNVGSPCTLIPLKISLGPGQRKRIATVRPADRDRAYSYRYAWTWTAS